MLGEFKMWVEILRENRADWPESKRLKLLAKAYRQGLEDRRRRLNEKRYIREAIAKHAEKGKVAVVWSGRDCDCVRYSGQVFRIKADWRSIEKHTDDMYRSADGPCSYFITSPSIARKEIEYESRDLAMEAFENGHPHYIIDSMGGY